MARDFCLGDNDYDCGATIEAGGLATILVDFSCRQIFDFIQPYVRTYERP